jgi:two-component system, OmpR family, sensor kinase
MAKFAEIRSRIRHFTRRIRFRVLAGFLLLLALATAASALVIRQVLYLRIDERIDQDLVQESKELRALSKGNDPETGKPFGNDVERIFEIFLERNIPSENQMLITYLEDRPFLRSRRPVPYRLDLDPRLTNRWSSIVETSRGQVETPEGIVEYLAIPLRAEGGSRGVFVDAVFRDHERDRADPAVVGAAAMGGLILLIGSFLAWRLTNQVLRPIKDITQAAHSISETDIGRRIEVTGDDEVAELAATFNEMLDRLEEAFSLQREFLDDASHELRTPITVIQGHLDLLEEDPEERRRTLELVSDELERMSRLVHDLLLLSRAQRPDFLNLDMVDVAALTDEIRTKSAALGSQDWKVERIGRGRIVADRQRLTQAIMQLAENAAKHTPGGKPIRIGSSVEDGTAAFWVTDSGPGVRIQDRDRIFERFGKGRGARRLEGSGLGLAIVGAIAHAHGGRVELDSEPGQGATFTLAIPTEGPRAQGVENSS